MSMTDKIKSAVTSAIGGINDMVCMYACPSTEWSPSLPWKTVPPDMIINPEPKEGENIMNIEYYKKQFADLFMKMEREHGYCKHVHVEHENEIKSEDGSVMSTDIKVCIEF